MRIESKGRTDRTSDEIVHLEQILGTSLPEHYREWLDGSGGGWIEELIIPGTGENGLLYELLSPSEIEAQRTNTGGFSVFVPDRYLVVGSGAGGGLAIGLSGDTRGAFFWADYDAAVDLDLQDSSSEEIMSKLAADFPDLLTTLGLET